MRTNGWMAMLFGLCTAFGASAHANDTAGRERSTRSTVQSAARTVAARTALRRLQTRRGAAARRTARTTQYHARVGRELRTWLDTALNAHDWALVEIKLADAAGRPMSKETIERLAHNMNAELGPAHPEYYFTARYDVATARLRMSSSSDVIKYFLRLPFARSARLSPGWHPSHHAAESATGPTAPARGDATGHGGEANYHATVTPALRNWLNRADDSHDARIVKIQLLDAGRPLDAATASTLAQRAEREHGAHSGDFYPYSMYSAESGWLTIYSSPGVIKALLRNERAQQAR